MGGVANVLGPGEVGRRAKLGKAAVENLAGFDLDKGNEMVAAMMKIWQSRREGESDNLLG